MDRLAWIRYRLENGSDSSYHPKGCILWNTSGKSKYGKMSVLWPVATKSNTEYVHRVAYILDHVVEYPGFKLPSDDDNEVSHLCHNSLCINTEHLSFEHRLINNDRKRQCVAKHVCIKAHKRCGISYKDCIF
jgi:hypothetical protein